MMGRIFAIFVREMEVRTFTTPVKKTCGAYRRNFCKKNGSRLFGDSCKKKMAGRIFPIFVRNVAVRTFTNLVRKKRGAYLRNFRKKNGGPYFFSTKNGSPYF